MAEKGKGLWHEKARPMAEKYCNAIMIFYDFLCFFWGGRREDEEKRRQTNGNTWID